MTPPQGMGPVHPASLCLTFGSVLIHSVPTPFALSWHEDSKLLGWGGGPKKGPGIPCLHTKLQTAQHGRPAAALSASCPHCCPPHVPPAAPMGLVLSAANLGTSCPFFLEYLFPEDKVSSPLPAASLPCLPRSPRGRAAASPGYPA